jgi:hypothetical protein
VFIGLKFSTTSFKVLVEVMEPYKGLCDVALRKREFLVQAI